MRLPAPRCLSKVASIYLFAGSLIPAGVSRAAEFVGPKACAECHKAETEVWSQTKHAASFKTVHKSPEAKKILEAAGGDKNIRANATCVQCHFTPEKLAGEAKPVVYSSVSCERCHGNASGWLKTHNDYGGVGVPKDKETAAHKAQRIASARKAGWIQPEMSYDVAANCMSCHGLANPAVDPAVFGKMLDAGHPFNAEFELLRYSQGSVRHRFYPPDPTVNAELSLAEQARFFVAGQAAKLVSAHKAAGKGPAAYQKAQARRLEDAKAALAKVKAPEAAALVAKPSEENARKLLAAIAAKDLSGELKSLFPAKADLK